MSSPFIPLSDVAALAAQVHASDSHAVILFQHDPFCGTSRAAYREMAQLPGPVYLVEVTQQQDLTRRIADQTGVRHESPQVLVLHGGVAVWSASHRAITANAVATALQPQPLAVPHRSLTGGS